MVRVSAQTTDPITAWRIRDALAQHPMLGGDASDIRINADQKCVVLEGWAMDAATHALALRLATRAAGHHAVAAQISIENCRRLRSIARHGTRLC